MSTGLATRMALRFLAAGLIAGLALSLAPTVPALADEAPVVRQPRVRVAPPRVRTVVRTVERVRYVPVYYTGCGGCGRPYAAPYSWAVRYAHYRYAYGYGYYAGYRHY